MNIDFFEHTNKNISKLNDSEKKMFDYVVKHLHCVKDMSIRELANECYTSTTSVFRFVKKLGFTGYTEFTNAIRITEYKFSQHDVPEVFTRKEYREEYLKNIIESVRVISSKQINRFNELLKNNPTIYLFSSGLSDDAASYAKHIFNSVGYVTVHPTKDYEIASAITQIKDTDILFAFSYTGCNPDIISIIENVKSNKNTKIVSITKATNNIIQSLSDVDFYVFSDELTYNGIDITSRISMIAIVEMIIYSAVQSNKDYVTTIPDL